MKPHLFAFVLILVTVAMFAQAQKSTLPLPDSGDVTLPLDEYNKLLELASRPMKKPDVAPQNFSIKCAEISCGWLIGGRKCAVGRRSFQEGRDQSPFG
jgi:hypothetical protein